MSSSIMYFPGSTPPSDASTAGVGGLIGGLGPVCGSNYVTGLSAGASGWGTTTAWAFLFYNPLPISITRVSLNVAAVSASASKFASAGIYSANGNTKLIDSGTFNVSTGQATGIKTNTISSVTFESWFLLVCFYRKRKRCLLCVFWR